MSSLRSPRADAPVARPLRMVGYNHSVAPVEQMQGIVAEMQRVGVVVFNGAFKRGSFIDNNFLLQFNFLQIVAFELQTDFRPSLIFSSSKMHKMSITF